jgi:4-hydroxy-tetrahydrodipicolinate synthase
MTKIFRPAGIYPVLYAFFDTNNQLDRAAMRRQVDAALGTGVPGIVILGLATEVQKLTTIEREKLIAWAAEDLSGRADLGVTISGTTVEEQRKLARYAEGCGADWMILQPPSEAALARVEPANREQFCYDFFAQVMDGFELPLGIQNAPEYLGSGLSCDAIERLSNQCPYFQLLKCEAPSVIVQQTIERLGKKLTTLNGRGGLELVDNLRAGCAGVIVAPDTFDWQLRIYRAFVSRELAEAEALYKRILPVIVFVMQSLETLVCYGKRIAAWRMGFEVAFDRSPRLAPTAWGVEAARRFARQLGQFP